MCVAVNGRFLHQRLTGTQRYACELVGRLSDCLEVIKPRRGTSGIQGHLWEQVVLPWRLKTRLLWSPVNTGPLTVRHQVVTIHDMAFVDHAYAFSPTFAAWYQWLVPKLARRVPRIITVSNFSRERIADLCSVPIEKIVTIFNGVDPRFRPMSQLDIAQAKQSVGLPSRYILCVGSLEPRKNIARLLAAWSLIRRKYPDLELVLVGATATIFRDIGLDNSPPAVHLARYVRDEDLPAIYSGAECFVFPSLYEGFGFPVIEAMSCGVPVVCSNVTSLPEVAGGAAYIVDPYSADSIASGIEAVVNSSALQAGLRERGFANAMRFSWERTAEITLRILREVD